jgi:hypothetical protein
MELKKMHTFLHLFISSLIYQLNIALLRLSWKKCTDVDFWFIIDAHRSSQLALAFFYAGMV